jgi:acetyltransferase-like isoleucine patch superfamily enzyme
MLSNLEAENFSCGNNLTVGSNVRITGSDGSPANNIHIGDNCYIGDNVQIRCDNFYLGDYARIHHHTNFHGKGTCHIGHNLWIGQYSIVDSQGSITIGNNCGIGAHSQLWSHIRYGDTLEGCRFNSTTKMEIEDDVWFVGHCIVSPIKAKSRSMAMVGSVVTKDMEYNTVYAGVPAKAISEKIGPQFLDVSVDEKYKTMKRYHREQGNPANIQIVKTIEDIDFDSSITFYNVSDRMYTKRLTSEEVKFMNYLLPIRAKFTPYKKSLSPSP